jgi:hypothetical protein
LEGKPLKPEKSCSNCLKGTAITVNSDILCRDKGAVSADYVCSNHRFCPFLRKESPSANKCIDCEYFICEFIVPIGMPAIGLCQLFTVRQFDGNLKNSCSKFIKKRSQLEVS